MRAGNNPAFPTSVQRGQNGDYWTEDEGGLTKRELFAAMAMQGICGDAIAGPHHVPPNTAKLAVEYADALLAELAK